MKTAIVHDWFLSYAGSERCVESFVNIWQDADVYTLVDVLNDEDRKIILKGKRTKTSFIQNLPFAKKNHRVYLGLFPYAIERFDLSKYDLIISSSHAVAKGILTNSNQLHICYCHTPIRYAWDLYHQYLTEANLNNGLKGLIAQAILHKIRIWDAATANRPDYFIANSNFISERIKKIYNRESTVIYPPVDVEKFNAAETKENYFLTASRLVPYKKVNLIIDAFAQMPDKKLIVIGDGPQMNNIKEKASRHNNIEIIGYQTFEKLKEYIQKAKAFVFAAEEDFGITLVEAMACGTPVIALNKGGAKETVIEGKTGILFDEQTTEALKQSILKFEKIETQFDTKIISEFSKQFSRTLFEENIKNFVNQKIKDFF